MPESKDQPSVPLDLRGRVILLATDGSPASQAATGLAQSLANERHAVVHVVNVVDTRSAPIPPPLDLALGMADTSTGQVIHEQQVRDVRAMIAGTTGQPCDWPVHVMMGTPASAVASVASRIGAALIVMGLRHHGRLDRVLHDETVLNVMHLAACPVLGVSEGLSHLPARVLVALDFSQTSGDAARAALSLLGANGSMVLAHVPPITGYVHEDGERVIRELGVQAGFDLVTGELRRAGGAVDSVILHHQTPRPVSELLLDYADEMRAEVIVAGSARRNRIDNWILGSVSTELVRAGTTSVLIFPPTVRS